MLYLIKKKEKGKALTITKGENSFIKISKWNSNLGEKNGGSFSPVSMVSYLVIGIYLVKSIQPSYKRKRNYLYLLLVYMDILLIRIIFLGVCETGTVVKKCKHFPLTLQQIILNLLYYIKLTHSKRLKIKSALRWCTLNLLRGTCAYQNKWKLYYYYFF